MDEVTDPDDPHPDDSDVLDAIRAWIGDDPPPRDMDERTESLITWLDVDEQLEQLLTEASETPAAVRSDGTISADVLEFEEPDGTAALEVSVAIGEVAGQVVSDLYALVELQTMRGDTRHAALDALGRFSFDDVPVGPTRLRLSGAGGDALVTPWFAV